MADGYPTRIDGSISAVRSLPCWRGWLLLCLVLLLVSSHTPPTQAQGRFLTEFTLDHASVEVPFEYQNHQIFVTVTVEDRKNLTFLFDTGASAPVIDQALDIKTYHLADTTIQEADGVTQGETVWISDLKLGAPDNGARVHNIATLVTDLSQISRVLGRKVDGIIGIPFCVGFVVEIDYERKMLRFFNPNTYSLASRVGDNRRSFVFNLTPSNAKRRVSPMLISGLLHEKYDYDFLLDTGFGGYLSVAHSAAEEAGLINEATPRVPVLSYSVSRSFRSEKVRAKYLMLGGIDLAGKVVSVDYRNNDVVGQTGILGNRLLQNYRVTLDYPHKKLMLERVQLKEEADDAETPSFGLVIRTANGTVTVDRVKKNSPAEKAGLKSGDAILQIDSREVANMPATEIASRLAAGTGITQILVRSADGENASAQRVTLIPLSPLDWK